MKLYESETVPVITQGLKMCIDSSHNSWEARQLFLLTSTLGKKTCQTLLKTCLHSTGQAVRDFTQSSLRLGVAPSGEGSQHPEATVVWSRRCSPKA